MHEELRSRVSQQFPQLVEDLASLVRIPSVSADGYPAENVRRSGEAVKALLEDAGLENVQLLELEGAHPAVFGEIPAPDGAPTVLLYAHHDVQPPGPAEEWKTDPWDPRRDGDWLYGRGSGDDKAGVAMHLGAIRALGENPTVGVKVFAEGEEEVGSDHLVEFLDKYAEMLAADIIVIGDSGNKDVDEPALTTSLRGLAACTIEVRTLNGAVHSGAGGGVAPDALMTLSRMLATLHDDDGNVAVEGLVSYESPPSGLSEEWIREEMGIPDEVELIGDGELSSRLWSKPAISVLAIDAPPVAEAINQLVPVAKAKVSMRISPGQDPDAALKALQDHLRSAAPWGALVSFDTGGDANHPFQLSAKGAAYDVWESAMEEAWGKPPIHIGVGGTIPFVAAFTDRYPDADILLLGPTSKQYHAPNEKVHLPDLEKGVLAEAIALKTLGELRT